ncbi:hypothetical protein YQE_04506, partial [Dendroctonus ponderosae]
MFTESANSAALGISRGQFEISNSSTRSGIRS